MLSSALHAEVVLTRKGEAEGDLTADTYADCL